MTTLFQFASNLWLDLFPQIEGLIRGDALSLVEKNNPGVTEYQAQEFWLEEGKILVKDRAEKEAISLVVSKIAQYLELRQPMEETYTFLSSKGKEVTVFLSPYVGDVAIHSTVPGTDFISASSTLNEKEKRLFVSTSKGYKSVTTKIPLSQEQFDTIFALKKKIKDKLEILKKYEYQFLVEKLPPIPIAAIKEPLTEAEKQKIKAEIKRHEPFLSASGEDEMQAVIASHAIEKLQKKLQDACEHVWICSSNLGVSSTYKKQVTRRCVCQKCQKEVVHRVEEGQTEREKEESFWR